MIQNMPEDAKHIIDGTSIGVWLGASFNLLPSIATLLTVIWFSIRIWETDTVQKLLKRYKS